MSAASTYYQLRSRLHLALGLKHILELPDKEEEKIVKDLKKMLEKTHLDV